MPLTVEATFENGVFVPVQRPALADHERVRLTVEPVLTTSQRLETIRQRGDQRIRLDTNLAQDIATSAEFDLDGN
jgi:predicted DNA-binding antitoxin AbrB/MazE fold protein